MAIGFAGIGSGSDWSTLISQLVQLESRTLTQLRAREDDLDDQVSDFGKVKSALDTFKTAMDGLQDDTSLSLFSGASTDEDVLTASADSTAVAGSYDIVVSQLAERDKIGSSAYADSNTAVGTGTLSLTVNGATSNITVDGTNNTLAGLRDAINDASDNPGVTATIINDTSGSRLVLTSNETGADNAIGISITDGDDANNTDNVGLSKLFYIGAGNDGYAEQVSTAANAQLTVDGFEVESASNAVSDAITGVTINLSAAGSSTITVDRDTSKIEEKVQSFVDAYNKLKDDFDVFEIGSLKGDSGLRTIENGFGEILNQAATIGGSSTYLFEIGITRDKYGKLSLDSSELSDAIANDFDKVSQLFSDDTTGFATRFYDYADQVLKEIVPSRQEGLSSQQRLLESRIEREEIHIDTYEKTLIERFAALDQTVSALQGTSNFLVGQMNS